MMFIEVLLKTGAVQLEPLLPDFIDLLYFGAFPPKMQKYWML